MTDSGSSVGTAHDVARYLLTRAFLDGELVSNLKMQKLVYMTYGETLANTGQRLFNDPIEAWANGPVVPSLYQELKQYRYGPIAEEFLGFGENGDIENSAGYAKLQTLFPSDVLNVMDLAYEKYATMSAFQLVALTHSHHAWIDARGDLAPTDRCNTRLRDEAIHADFLN